MGYTDATAAHAHVAFARARCGVNGTVLIG
jgi:hypothetical protein